MKKTLAEALEQYNIDSKKPIYHYKNIRMYCGADSNGVAITVQQIHNKDQDVNLVNSFLQQYQKLKTIQNPNIIDIHHDPIVTPDNYLFVAWKTPQGLLFTDYLAKQLSINEVLTCVRQLSTTIQALHCNHIYTHSIHHGNIIYTLQKKFIIPCYGLFTNFSHVTKYAPFASIYSKQNMVYSLGILIYQLLTKATNFPSETDMSFFKKSYFSYKKTQFPWQEKIFSTLIDIIGNCLVCDKIEFNFDMITKQIDELIKIYAKNSKLQEQKTKRIAKQNLFCDHSLGEILGKGASATVFKAFDIYMKRDVALKVMHDIPKNEKNLLRFKREAQAIAKLEHENIVKLYKIDEHNKVPFFSMEYINGYPLDEYITQKNLSFEQIVHLFIKILYALQYAHQKKIIHRDLKPSNILVDKEEGKPYIMDFGVAKIGDASYQITATGELIGTIFFMSPEQVRGKNKKIDIRTDIYSMGIMLYQALTQKLPFDEKSTIKLMHKICSTPPTQLRKINEKIPPILEFICLKAMAKMPQDRYRSTTFMIRDLENFLTKPQLRTYLILKTKNLLSTKNLLITSIVLCVFFFFSFLSQQSQYSENDQNVFVYLDSEDNFKKKLAAVTDGQERDAIYGDFIIFQVIEKKYNDAIQLYQKIENVEVKESDRILLAIAKSYYFIEDFQKARDFLGKVATKTKEEKYLQECFYYKGLIFYNEEKWAQSIVELERARNFCNNKQDLFYAQTLLRLGISYVNINSHEKGLPLLKETADLIPLEVQAWEYLGQCYLSSATSGTKEDISHFEEAHSCFLKCLEIEPSNSMYYVYLSQSLTHLKRYNEAYDNLEISLSLKYNNVDALNSLVYLCYQEPSLQEIGLQLQKQIIHLSIGTKEPDLFQYYYKNLERAYYDSFMQKSLVLKNANSPQVFLDILCSGDLDHDLIHSVVNGLFSLRYHPDILQMIHQYQNKNSSSTIKKILTNIKEKIQNATEKESSFALYYQIIRYYNQLQETPRNINITNKELSSKVLRNIFIDESTNILIKYACAKILVRSSEWELLESAVNTKFPEKNTRVLHQMIYICVLREFDYLQQITFEQCIQVFEFMKEQNRFSVVEKEFLECMIAKNLYKYSIRYPLHSENVQNAMRILEILFSSQSNLVHLVSAASIYSIVEEDEKHSEFQDIYQEAKTVIISAMEKSSIYAAYAHYFFWNKPSTLNKIELYNSPLLAGLNHNKKEVLEIVLFHMMKFGKRAEPYQEKLQNIMRENINSFISLRTVFILSQLKAMHPEVVKIQRDRNTPAFLAVYAFIVTKYFYILSPAKQFDFAMLKNLQDVLSRREEVLEYNEDFRSFIYFASSALGFYNADLLLKESDKVAQANIISNFKQLDRAMPFLKRFRKETPESERLQITQKYLNDDSSFIRKSSISSNIYLLQNENERDAFFFTIFDKGDVTEKEGAALGYYSLIYNDILRDADIFSNNPESLFKEEAYITYTNLFTEKVAIYATTNVSQFALYKKWLSRAIELFPRDTYFYEQACIYIVEKKYNLAFDSLKNAIKYSPKNSLYYYQIANVMLNLNTAGSTKEKIMEELQQAVTYGRYAGLLVKIAALYESLEKWDEAEQLYQRIFIQSPYSLKYTINWVRLLVKKGNHQKANDVLEKILFLDKKIALSIADSELRLDKSIFETDEYLNILWQKYPEIKAQLKK